MTPMTLNKPKPFLLLVITISLLIVALLAFWLAMVPQRMLAQLTTRLQQESGLTLEARNPRLRFFDGLALQLESVALSGNPNTTTSLSVQNLDMDVGIAALFGGSVSAGTLTLETPVIDLDVSPHAMPLMLPAKRIVIREGTVKLRDTSRKAVIAVTDVNGQITADAAGGSKLDASFMLNNTLTTLVADAENAQRLMAAGSPADVTLSSKDKIVSFSGRARLKDGVALDGQITVEAPDTAAALSWLGMPLDVFKGAGNLSLVSGLSSDGLSASFNAAILKIGATEITGQARLLAGPDRMQLTGDLASAEIALLATSQSVSLLAQPWSEAPYNAASLTALDSDLKVVVQKLLLRGVELGSADISIKGTGGTTVVQATLPMAKTEMTLTLTPKNGATAADVSMATASGDVGQMIKAVSGFDHVAGDGDLTLQARSEGNNLAAHISSLKGKAGLKLAKASITGIDLTTLLVMPGEGWQTADSLRTDDIALSFEAALDEGVAVLSKAEATLPGLAMKPTGEVDLLRQAFNLALHPKGKNLDPKLILGGTWMTPRFSLNTGSAPALRPTSEAKKVKAAATPPAN